jgi:hypothetical protein
MEMFFAYQHGIPVIVWMRPDIKRSAWLRHHSVFITDKRDEVIKHLMTIEPASSGKVFPEDPH